MELNISQGMPGFVNGEVMMVRTNPAQQQGNKDND
jgi:hypothetical protein